MPTARDRGAPRAAPAASRRRTLIGTRAAFVAGSALPSAWKTGASPNDAISQFSPSAGLSASMAILQHQNAIITGIAKAACHAAEAIRIVLRDAAAASRRSPVFHSSG